jgi:hypothetical protein
MTSTEHIQIHQPILSCLGPTSQSYIFTFESWLTGTFRAEMHIPTRIGEGAVERASQRLLAHINDTSSRDKFNHLSKLFLSFAFGNSLSGIGFPRDHRAAPTPMSSTNFCKSQCVKDQALAPGTLGHKISVTHLKLKTASTT